MREGTALSPNTNPLMVYNPAEKPKSDLKREFVVRGEIFDSVFKEIKATPLSSIPRHYLIVAQRGAGKTTLMYRLKYAIDDDVTLQQLLVPVNLGEEQYQVNSLLDLWQALSDILEDYHGFPDLFNRSYTSDELTSEERGSRLLGQELQKRKKRVVLFVENFGELLKKLDESEIGILENVLRESNWLQLVAGTPISLDNALESSRSRFDVFKTIELKGLNYEETKALLLKLAELNGAFDKIDKIIKENPQRVEVLRRLTGGVIRTMVLLFKIFLETEDGKSVKDLQMILDSVTPLYKHRMDDLPHQQQKIVDVVAKNWDAISVKDITLKSKIPSKVVSAQLRQLEKNYVITKVETNSKNHLYQLTERFLNIWYLMRYGRRDDKRRVTWLVRFFDAWCSKQELEDRVKRHIENLGSDKYDANSALFMGQAYLSCTGIGREIKERLVETTASAYPDDFDAKRFNLDDDVVKEALRLLQSKKIDEAIEKLDELRNLTSSNYRAVVRIAWEADDSSRVLKFLRAADENGFASKFDLHVIGSILEKEFREYSEALKFYQRANDLGYKGAKFSIARILYKRLNVIDDAEKMLLQLTEEDPKNSDYYHELGHLYGYHKVDYGKAISNFQKAIELGRTTANHCLGALYHLELKDFEQARLFYSKEAAGKNYNLGILYHDLTQDDETSIAYLEKAVKEDNMLDAYYYLGKVYERSQRTELAINYYNLAYKEANIEHALHRLGHIYSLTESTHKEAEKYFKLAIQGGDNYSRACLAHFYYINNLNKDEAEQLIVKAKEDYPGEPFIHEVSAHIMFSTEKFEEAINDLAIVLKDETYVERELKDITTLIINLLAKHEYRRVLGLFDESKIKDMLKPAYFALMTLMQEEFPNEHLKMGEEIAQTVGEIIEKVKSKQKEV